MSFESGPISFIICKLGTAMPDDAVEKFSEKKAWSLETVLDEPQIGWVSGRHLLDTRIDQETAYSGGYLHLSLRSAQRKIPASLLKAEIRMEELAYMKEKTVDSVPRKNKKAIKEAITDRLIKDMPPSLTGIPFVVNSINNMIYLGTNSRSQIDQFLSYFCETIGFEPIPLTPPIAAEILYNTDPNSLIELTFAPKPFDSKSDEISIGRDFATWLWFFQENEGGTFEVEDFGTFGVLVDGPLVFASEGRGALEAVVRKGLPTSSAEAKAALLVGKKLKQAKIIIARDDQSWVFTLEADSLAFRGMTLPEIEEGLDSASRFQERITLLNIFHKAFSSLFKRYLNLARDTQKVMEISDKFHQWIEHLDAESTFGTISD